MYVCILSFINCAQGNCHDAVYVVRSSSVRRGATRDALRLSNEGVKLVIDILRDSRLDPYLRSLSSAAPCPSSTKSAFLHRFKHDNSISQIIFGKFPVPGHGMDAKMVRGCCPDRSRYTIARRFISTK